jgi:hypothetical protein
MRELYIAGIILKELPIIWVKYLAQLFRAALPRRYFPPQWKVAQIILIVILPANKPINQSI